MDKIKDQSSSAHPDERVGCGEGLVTGVSKARKQRPARGSELFQGVEMGVAKAWKRLWPRRGDVRDTDDRPKQSPDSS